MKWRVAVLAFGLLAAVTTPVHADTGAAPPTDPATALMATINQERTSRGLVPLQLDSRLWAIAHDRATRLATSEILSHSIAGSMPQDLADHGVRWFGYGEVIGYASGSPGVTSRAIFRMWMASADHWPLLMSARYNYLGVGLVYQASSGLTYSSVVLTESLDRTVARAAVAGALVSGNDIRWSWRGWDVSLQTHTSGLRDFALQLRMDRGSWVTIGNGVTATARWTTNRIRGHWYGLRVRARDRAGNVGPWSRELRVWLP
ncbi:MAG: CAP domain-containing protein [Candidatus Limnocylindrales bacterium]